MPTPAPDPSPWKPPPVRGLPALVDRLRRDPWGLLARAWQKLIVGPMRYRRGGDYAAAEYWRERLGKHAHSLRGPGHEGLSEKENARMYSMAVTTLREACSVHGVHLATATVLDAGCGGGVFTRACKEWGVREYVGLDVTDVLFPVLRAAFPGYQFVQADFTTDPLPGKFDLVLALDVLDHVVDRTRFEAALANLAGAVKEGGTLFVALPMAEGSPKPLYYLRLWSLQDIVAGLSGLQIEGPVPWRDGSLLIAQRPHPKRAGTD